MDVFSASAAGREATGTVSECIRCLSGTMYLPRCVSYCVFIRLFIFTGSELVFFVVIIIIIVMGPDVSLPFT